MSNKISTKIIYRDQFIESDITDLEFLLKDSTRKNYQTKDWQTNPHSLFYRFFKTSQFQTNTGGLVLLYHNDIIKAVSGFTRSHFHDNIYILGVRTFIANDLRHHLVMSNILIPEQIKQVQQQAKCVIFLFDPADKSNLYNIVRNQKLNLFLKNKLKTFSHLWKNLQAIEFPISIYNNIVQNALYIKLHENFEFDWNTVKAHDV